MLQLRKGHNTTLEPVRSFSHEKDVFTNQINCQELVPAGFNELCFDIGIPQNSVVSKSDMQIYPKYEMIYFMQLCYLIFQIKSTNMGYLELEGF